MKTKKEINLHKIIEVYLKRIESLEKETSKAKIHLYNHLQEMTSLESPELSGWDCKKSPIKKCIYDMSSQMGSDSCIYCGSPDERY